jgi:hypothetical protein
MVRHHFSTMSTTPDTVSNRRRQGTNPGLHHRLRVRHCRVRQACQTTQTRDRLPHKVSFSLSSSRCTHTTDHLDGQAPPRHLSPWPRRPSPGSKPTSSPSSHAGPTSILVGHSLESDLKALRSCHPLCIDTALVYHHPRGRLLKPGLA